MNIAYFNPLSRAFGRMKKALFQPFDIKKWFVVGFTVFLAELLDGPHGGGQGEIDGGCWSDIYWRDVYEAPLYAWDWLVDHPGWFMLIVFGIVFISIIGILLTWLSSRGKFMFLYNVVHDRAEVVNPWKQYSTLGNSLFLFRLFFGFICFVLIISYLILGFVSLIVLNEGYFPSHPPVGFLILYGLVFFALILTIMFIVMVIDDFIVPIMYKHNMRILQALGKFLSLFGRNFFYFIGYAILILILVIIVFILIMFFGIMTCCIGFILVILPYIGSVVTLPISYAFRAFSLEFLAQFGPEYNLFEDSEVKAVDVTE